MNVTEVQKTLFDWVAAESGIAVEWERANSPRLIRPYIGLLILALVPIGTAYISPPDDDGIATIVGQSVMSLSINTYMGMKAADINAINILELLRLSLWKESVKTLFRDKGIGYLASTNNQNIEQIVGTEFEERGVLDINFLICSSITDDVGLIERAEGVGEYYDYTGQLTHTEEFNAEV